MNDQAVEARVAERLAQDKRGDRGWFIITRVHVDAFWLRGIAEYIYRRAGDKPLRPSFRDYENLAKVAGIDNSDPGIQLRRHHLLVMHKPLQLIERTKSESWDEIQLTQDGVFLAQTPFFSQVLEKALDRITFAKAPAIPNDRVQAYSQFDVRAYRATKIILSACDGYIDRDEFDYFVSRVRETKEIQWAIDGVLEYRHVFAKLNASERIRLKKALDGHVHKGLTPKQYQNWRDIGLHTFSLFGLGTSMVRQKRELWLTTAAGVDTASDSDPVTKKAPVKKAVSKPTPPNKHLKIPVPPESPGIPIPPVAASLNGGAEAENHIAKLLQADGWKVVFYSDKRGYGFDIWAAKELLEIMVEVKSSLGSVTDVSLTSLEYQAAKLHGANYVLAIVEKAHSENPIVWFIPDPAAKLEVVNSQTIAHRIRQSTWKAAAIAALS